MPKASAAEIMREYGPFSGIDAVYGVSFDGRRLWFSSGEHLHAIDPDDGAILRTIALPADAGTAFDGACLYQIGEGLIRKVDPDTGDIVATIPTPGGDASGLSWGVGALWIGRNRARLIHRIDPESGAVLGTIASDRFVTGVSWIDGALWHGAWDGTASEIRRVDPETGAVLTRLTMPAGTRLAGLANDGGARFFCGGGASATIRAVRRPGVGCGPE